MATKAKVQRASLHSRKVAMATKLRTKEELLGKVSIWNTKGWAAHRKAVERRVRAVEQRN